MANALCLDVCTIGGNILHHAGSCAVLLGSNALQGCCEGSIAVCNRMLHTAMLPSQHHLKLWAVHWEPLLFLQLWWRYVNVLGSNFFLHEVWLCCNRTTYCCW